MLLVSTSGLNTWIQFISVLLIFVFVLAITYVTTRWIANYQKGHTFDKNIKIIETCKIAPNKYLQIIKTGEKYIVVGIGKDTVTMLTELSKEQITCEEETQMNNLSFKEVLEKAKNLKLKK